MPQNKNKPCRGRSRLLRWWRLRRLPLLPWLCSGGMPLCLLLHAAWQARAARRRRHLGAVGLLLLQQAHADGDAAWAHANEGVHDQHIPLAASRQVVQQRGAQPRLAHHLRGRQRTGGAGRAVVGPTAAAEGSRGWQRSSGSLPRRRGPSLWRASAHPHCDV